MNTCRVLGSRVPEKAGLLSKKAWLQSQLQKTWSFRLSMSKQPLKNVVSMLIKDKDITSYQLSSIKQDRVLVR